MRDKIEIALYLGTGERFWLVKFPLMPDDEPDPPYEVMSDEQVTDLVLGRVRDWVTAELL